MCIFSHYNYIKHIINIVNDNLLINIPIQFGTGTPQQLFMVQGNLRQNRRFSLGTKEIPNITRTGRGTSKTGRGTSNWKGRDSLKEQGCRDVNTDTPSQGVNKESEVRSFYEMKKGNCGRGAPSPRLGMWTSAVISPLLGTRTSQDRHTLIYIIG